MRWERKYSDLCVALRDSIGGARRGGQVHGWLGNGRVGAGLAEYIAY